MERQLQEEISNYAASGPPLTPPMIQHLEKLTKICKNPVVQAAFNEAAAHVVPYTETGEKNLWQNATIEDFMSYFKAWFPDLPNTNSGLGYILPFTWFYLNNYSAFFFLNKFKSRTGTATEYTLEIFDWVKRFIMIRGEYMDSPDSTLYIKEWTEDPNTHMEDFIVPPGGFKSYNEFFARKLKITETRDPRPVTPGDSIVTASADTIINFILSDLRLDTKMDVKGRQMSMTELLDDSEYAKHFVGGNAVSCVLMPNVYHHYHSPVTGMIVEGKDVPGIYNGIIDGEHWFNDMENPGQSDTDFSMFQDFHRAYYVIETEDYGYVAVVPVGLNTISRIRPSLVGKVSTYVEPRGTPVRIEKGQELGYFQYGGSLNILMFEKGVFPSVSVLMGNRIGEMIPKETEKVGKVRKMNKDRLKQRSHRGDSKV